ncbi:hypothetical protein CKO15_06730 [Halorhodospira abdelmalekii]|nr:hypothetical protein [Halorhodospira abdelmalekii]
MTIELEDGKSLKAWQLINDSRGAADAADATAAAADAAPAEESPTEETPAGESASATGATGTGTDATYAATTGTGTDASDADAADTKTSARVTAVALERIGRGYAGDIGVIVGIDRDGRVIAARVTEHRETPGLGDDIEARRSDWIEMFRGRSLGDPPSQRWTVKRDGGEFDQLTGATISARAVIEAVHEGLALFEEHREALLTPQPDDEDDDEEAIAAD